MVTSPEPSFRYFKSAGRSVLKRVTIPQQTHPRWNWKCYNSVATANFDRNGKMQPTAECHGLQLKHSGAHKVLLPLLFDLQHRFEAAEAIGIAKLFFPKPQQHCNQSTSLVHSPPPNSIESCTWYSWTCNAWKKQAGSRRFC